MSRIIPTLWYSADAEEAAAFYATLLPDSRVNSVTALPADSPSGPAGSVRIVDFTLLGQPFLAFSAKSFESFNHSIVSGATGTRRSVVDGVTCTVDLG